MVNGKWILIFTSGWNPDVIPDDFNNQHILELSFKPVSLKTEGNDSKRHV